VTRQLARSSSAGYADTVLPLSALFEGAEETKPSIVWFTTLNADDKLERRLFDSWEVAVASRYFNCVKIYVDDIESKADRDRYAKVAPTIIVLDGSSHEVAKMAGSAPSSPVVYAAMQKASTPTFKKPLSALVETYGSFLKRFDKVQGQVAQLEGQIADDLDHTSKHDCAPGRKMLKEHQDEIKPLTVERDKLLEQEKTLLKPELKSKETAEASSK
jgi:hypothetical protein